MKRLDIAPGCPFAAGPHGSVDEIKAEHVLHRETTARAILAVRGWFKMLKPGGTVEVSVPDFGAFDPDDPLFESQVMGTQETPDDVYRSIWTREKLQAVMEDAGFTDIIKWGIKPAVIELRGTRPHSAPASPKDGDSVNVRVGACLSVPRYGSMEAYRTISLAVLLRCGIGIRQTGGVFWGQCMQRMFEAMLDECDIILTLDFDSMVTEANVRRLLQVMAERPEIDCLAPLEHRREKEGALFVVKGQKTVRASGPVQVDTAHFGLTAIRTEALRKVAKPWFKGQPDENGEWGDDRLDDDIWFWKQWREAGNSVFVDPHNKIGHLVERVIWYGDDNQPRTTTVKEWRENHLG